MAYIKSAIICCIFIFSISLSYASCETNIPGHYPNRFAENGDGTVTDRMTGLMWQKCLMGMKFSLAKQTCVGPATENEPEVRINALNWQLTLQQVMLVNSDASINAGYNDWRLPNIKELASIMDLSCLDPGSNYAMDDHVFKNRTLSSDSQQTAELWSSTPHRRVGAEGETGTLHNQAWKLVVRGEGGVGARPSPINVKLYARLVRGN